ncbi:MAG: SusC/RagA family TonB-linked outer membrane protein, partial [Flavobacteriaceae bacterium]|nr:SusC/RagA family TonB-linked outer membrane protein [Flavobacteriaceae bacterium]
MKKVIKLLLFSVLSLQMVVAQKTITGVVSDNEGLPLPGATILVEGTSTGVTTDFDGNFSINAEEGDTLNISYVGYQSQSIVIGDQDTLNISLELGNELEEVVVTSLGIKREAKALGYAVQSVSTED